MLLAPRRSSDGIADTLPTGFSASSVVWADPEVPEAVGRPRAESACVLKEN